MNHTDERSSEDLVSAGFSRTDAPPAAGSADARPGRMQWYAYRLMAMSPAELAHRVLEQARRHHHRRAANSIACPDGALPIIPGMRERLLTLAEDSLPLAEWKALYHKTARGEYSALGREWPRLHSSEDRWHLDPVTGNCWPKDAYCFDIDYRRADGMGDIKYVWELNRLQHLQPIAAYAARSGDREANAFCREQIASWIGSNPPYQGVNWSSGIELALRVVSFVVVATMLGAESFSTDERRQLLSCLAAHGRWIARFPSRFSSANNHLVAEAGGLFVLGTLARDLPGASAWRAYGRATLRREIARQIAGDGVGLEQSPTYTAFSLEWWLLAQTLAREEQDSFPSTYTERVHAACTFLRWMLDKNDNIPRIGDDDEGRVIFSPQDNDAYVPSVLQAAAGELGAGDIAPNGSYPHLWRALHPSSPPAEPAPTGIRTFSEGGYSVVRESSAQGELLLAFDHGPLGYLSIAAHGHADTLALWLHLGGRPVLVDAGTFLYHSGGAWRDYLRGTAAHNTLCLAGHDSSRTAGPFNWSRKARGLLLDSQEKPGFWRVSAEHDGYRSAFGVSHQRTVAKISGDTLEVVDRLVGARRVLAVEVGFLFHPSLRVEPDGSHGFLVAAEDVAMMKIASSGPLVGCIEYGQLSPPRGWYSPKFGALEKTTRIAFRGSLQPERPSKIIFSILNQ